MKKIDADYSTVQMIARQLYGESPIELKAEKAMKLAEKLARLVIGHYRAACDSALLKRRS